MTEPTLQERLREAAGAGLPATAWQLANANYHVFAEARELREAADKIDCLTAEVERLRALADERFAEIKRAQGIIDDLKAFRERVLTERPSPYRRGQEDMRERAALTAADCTSSPSHGVWIRDHIRALPAKEQP